MDENFSSLKQNKYMSFEIKKDELLEKYSEISDKVSNIGKTLDTRPVFEEKHLNPKLKHHNSRNNTYFW